MLTYSLTLGETTPRPRKSLSQNFLAPAFCERIVRFAGVEDGDRVVEIGPGTGNLTQALLAAQSQVTAIEFDPHLIQHLLNRFSSFVPHQLTLVEADALQVDWEPYLADGGVKLVSNLPYHIATPLIRKMTKVPTRFQSLTLLVQKEVADRILANPGVKDYGYFSVLVQSHFKPLKGPKVPAGAFHPVPKVSSQALGLFPKTGLNWTPQSWSQFESLIKISFRHPRKTLRNNLSNFPSPLLKSALEGCQIPLNYRPEEISIDQYRCLVGMLYSGS